MRHRVQHRRFGHRVEHDALHLGLAESFALLEGLKDVPGDRLALTIRVGGENQPVGLLHRIGNVLEPLLSPLVDLPNHLEIGIGIDRTVFGGKVADMAITGQNRVILAEIFIDRLGLGGRLDNDNAEGFWHRSRGRNCV